MIYFFTEQIESLQRMHHKEISTESGASTMHSHSAEVMEPHSVIGVALVLGFIFMLLIDQISSTHGRLPAQGKITSFTVYIYIYCYIYIYILSNPNLCLIKCA